MGNSGEFACLRDAMLGCVQTCVQTCVQSCVQSGRETGEAQVLQEGRRHRRGEAGMELILKWSEVKAHDVQYIPSTGPATTVGSRCWPVVEEMVNQSWGE